MIAEPTFSLIFVNYHSVWQLSSALESLFMKEPDRQRYEVVVVNNDALERAALGKLQRLLGFTLLESSENRGFGSACNLGAAHASGSIIGFINPDTLWQGVFLSEIAHVFQGTPLLGVLGLTLLDSVGAPELWSGGAFPSVRQMIKNNFLPEYVHRLLPRDPLDWVSGAGLFIRRETFQAVQGFDQNFFLYFEDVDLCWRVQQRGLVIKRDRRFTLRHFGGQSLAGGSLQKKYFYTSQSIYYKKHRPKWEDLFLQSVHAVRQSL